MGLRLLIFWCQVCDVRWERNRLGPLCWVCDVEGIPLVEID